MHFQYKADDTGSKSKTFQSLPHPRVILSLILICSSFLITLGRGYADKSNPPSLSPPPAQITVDTRPSSLANSFIPDQTIGAGVDGVANGQVKNIYTPSNVAQILTAGDGPLSYRLYTELSVQQWHWNPSGTWSDPIHHCGYFTGDTNSKNFVQDTYGYRLPHRGGTHDQGNDDDYSRLDDGDLKTYWKSNPYLSSAYTHEADTLHPQWVIVDLGSSQPVDAVHIDWVNPYATSFDIQYCIGDDPIDTPNKVQWQEFPNGAVTNSQGGSMTLQVAPQPIKVQFIRVLMTASSGTYNDDSATDPRSAMGYAIAEVGVGTLDADNKFNDLVTHRIGLKQTVVYCSSVDPWHTPIGKLKTEEQPGFDTVFRSGITRGLPAMVPVAILYETPEDAVAELTFLHNRGYKISYVELGEEPEQQWMVPEDYAALYCEWATAIHAKFPELKLGGPVFAGQAGVQTWPNLSGETDWLQRFYEYLQAHRHAQDMAFYSFEFYPASDKGFAGHGLYDSLDAVGSIFNQMRAAHLPSNMPAFLTEYNLADYAPEQPAIFGAVWHADFVADFLTSGGKGIYFYEYEPLPLGSDHPPIYGNFSMFLSDGKNKIRQPLSQYFSSRLTNLYWCDSAHPDGRHDIFPAASSIPKVDNRDPVTAYAIHRPDGQWSVMLINRSEKGSYSVAVKFDANTTTASFEKTVRLVQFSPNQYVFHANGKNGYADPDGPEKIVTLSTSSGTLYTLPAQSITVLTGFIK